MRGANRPRSIGAQRQAEDSAIDVDWNTTGRNRRMKIERLEQKIFRARPILLTRATDARNLIASLVAIIATPPRRPEGRAELLHAAGPRATARSVVTGTVDGITFRGHPIGDCPRRPQATRGNATQRLSTVVAPSAARVKRATDKPREETASGPFRRVLMMRSRPSATSEARCARVQRQGIDSLSGTLIRAVATLGHRSDVLTGPRARDQASRCDRS
jgi:hypothetical protein